ncbi:hypothetical protein M8J75_011804 [Diaphorina citri]|nr:hypothetical protein M8J75_011804 [Diaphorina citri]
MTQDLSTRSRTAPPSQENESSSAEPPAHSTALQQRLEASPPVIELTTIKRRLSSEDERNTPSPRPQTPSPPPDCPEPSNLSLKEDRSPSPPDVDDVSSMQSGPSDMTLNSRIPSPLSGEPVPGPSGLPPVQQVPLSLKKEVDWDSRGDDKSTTGESSSDYRHVHDPDNSAGEMSDSRALFPCMYCGLTFPHQSKLTRHILSHSLESLKFREHQLQHSSLISMVGLVEPLMEGGHYISQHPQVSLEPPILPEVTNMEVTGDSPQNALCKFCGKSFPDVSALITHLPVHTGDRPFKCEFCGKAFKLRHHMKDHCRVHTGERPFKCSICGKTFSRSTILKAHEKTHYPKYTRKFLSSPNSPDDDRERRPPDLSSFTLPCDLSSTPSEPPQMYLPRSPTTP